MSRIRGWLSKRNSKSSDRFERTTHPQRAAPVQRLEKTPAISLEWAASEKREQHNTGFLDLPRELRDSIYRHALVLEQPFDLGDQVSSRRISILPWKPAPWNKYPRAGALLCTCKQVHAEAASVLYGENRFEISLASGSMALQDLLIVDERVNRCTNKFGIPDRLTGLSIHPTYRELVTNLAFRSGSMWARRDQAFHFLLPMMSHFRNAEGAYFRIQSNQHLSRVSLSRGTCVAGWQKGNREKALSPHNKYHCEHSISSHKVLSSDELVLEIARMAEIGPCKAPFAIKDLQFNLHAHWCLRGGGHVESQESLPLPDTSHLSDVLKAIYIFTPILNTGSRDNSCPEMLDRVASGLPSQRLER